MAKEPKTADSGFMTQEPTNNNDSNTLDVLDCVSRQAAIDEIARWIGYIDEDMILRIQTGLKKVPSTQPEQHYCRECKWSRCHANVDKHGKCETYWQCLNWDGETDEEGYCHEWERRTDG